MTVQRRNDQMVELLRTDFQHRYESNFAWLAAASAHQQIPMLRGYWPMSNVGSTPTVLDLSANGRTLTYNGNPTFNVYDLAPYIDLDGTGDYLHRPDEAGLDILGTEAYVAAARQGVACGGWFWTDGLGTTDGLITKWDAANQCSYALYIGAAGNVTFRISDNGTTNPANLDTVTSTNAAAANSWFWAAGTWSGTGGSTTMSVWLNGTRTDAVPTLAAIFNSTSDLVLGGWHAGAPNLLDGRISQAWLAASCIAPDPTTEVLGFSIYEQTRSLFDV